MSAGARVEVANKPEVVNKPKEACKMARPVYAMLGRSQCARAHWRFQDDGKGSDQPASLSRSAMRSSSDNGKLPQSIGKSERPGSAGSKRRANSSSPVLQSRRKAQKKLPSGNQNELNPIRASASTKSTPSLSPRSSFLEFLPGPLASSSETKDMQLESIPPLSVEDKMLPPPAVVHN